MRRLDRRGVITFIDAADGTSVCPRDRNELLAYFYARENGAMLSGAAAFAAMWRAIPVLRPIGLIARNTVVLGVLELSYRSFLYLRPALQTVVRRFDRSRR